MEMNKFIDENLASGRIRPSKSEIASPFFFIKKKTANLRPVQDYRKVNKFTKKNHYPLPLISELLDKIKDAKWFTKFDIRKGYNNIQMKEGDEWKAAFKTNRGLFEPLVMFFSLCNSPGTFQTFMDHIFQELRAKGYVVIYMDDILIFSTSLEAHREAVKEVLGFIVGNEQICMDPGKVAAIKEWKSPRTKKELQTFLGFANFYRRFIKNFAEDSLALTPLTGKKEWKWEDEQEKAFRNILNKMCAEPVLWTIKDE